MPSLVTIISNGLNTTSLTVMMQDKTTQQRQTFSLPPGTSLTAMDISGKQVAIQETPTPPAPPGGP